MIAGEIEQEIETNFLDNHEYDTFANGLFKQKENSTKKKVKKKLTPEERADRRDRRNNTLQDIGSLGTTLSDTLQLFRGTSTPQQTQSTSYEFGLDTDNQTFEDNNTPPKKKIPMEMYFLITLGALGVGIMVFKAVKQKPNVV